jgi:hypothetical protein
MIYTFARVGAVLQMKVGDYFRRGWVRLHEKGGKSMKRPASPNWKVFRMNTSRRRASQPTRTARYSAPPGSPPARLTA